MALSSEETEVVLRAPTRADGAALHALIRRCPPLDLNSVYAYFLVCDHFRETTVLAEMDGNLVGCVTGYRPPPHPDTMFIWQVAVDAPARGRGLAGKMLTAVMDRPAVEGVCWMETTISPSNTASRRLFASWAAARSLEMQETTYLEAEDFLPAGADAVHEAERLFRIGPIPNGKS